MLVNMGTVKMGYTGTTATGSVAVVQLVIMI